MKTLIKITALAVLAAFAVFSCGGPEAELTNVDWNEVNTKYDSGKHSSFNSNTITSGINVVSGALSTAEGADNELNITFPASSDFLRTGSEASVRSGLNFLSFHHFTKAAEPIAGKADNLGSPLTYTFVKRVGNVITVKLTKTFGDEDSAVIMKIDGTKYTFSGGNKLDRANKGRNGVTNYDDVYRTINVSGATGPTSFIPPGNQGWYLSLYSISETPSATATPPVLTDREIAYLNASSADATIADAVANQLKGGLKIQKFTNGSWVNVNAGINYISASRSFTVSSLSLEDLTPFRVVWEGSAPVVTTGKYFDVNQYIGISGANAAPSAPAYYQSRKVYGSVGTTWYNTYDNQRFNAPTPTLISVSRDSQGQNLVIELGFASRTYGDPAVTHWIKNYTNDQQRFRNNFKIAYYNGNGTGSTLTTHNDVVYAPIRNFEFFTHNPDALEDIGLNAVRITFDPEYKEIKKLYFYISPEIRYDGDQTTFGSADYLRGFFQVYEIADLIPFVPPSPYPRLTENEWVDGNLISSSSEDWYSFPVTAGTTYYIWWNGNTDNNVGDGTKTALAVVGARYADSSSWIFGGAIYDDYYNGYNSPRYFTAYQTGYVEVRVIPYNRSSYYIGTYGIVYSTGSTRPANY